MRKEVDEDNGAEFFRQISTYDIDKALHDDLLPHKNQKWIYKIKMLQIDQFIVSNFKFIVSQKGLFYLIIKFKFLTKSKNGSKNINCYK